MRLHSKIVGACVAGVMIAQSGCYDWEMVKPTELPKLSGSFSEPVARTANTTLVAVRVVDVERPDGTLAQIKGEFDLRVILVSGNEMTFQHPVAAEREGDDVVIRGGNRAATRIPIAQIARAEASQYAQGKTSLVLILGSLALGGILGFALVSIK